MRLLFKQRFFSWLDSYDIYDEDGNTVFVVKGELSWGHRLQIYDACGNHLGTVQEQVLTWLPRFELYAGGRQVGTLEKEFTLFRPRFTLKRGRCVLASLDFRSKRTNKKNQRGISQIDYECKKRDYHPNTLFCA